MTFQLQPLPPQINLETAQVLKACARAYQNLGELKGVLETLPALLICTPVLLPVAQAVGIDPIHFGVVLCFNLIVGMITPPMGIGLYVMVAVSRLRFEEVTRASMPFLIPLLIALVIITFVPALSLWLPEFLLGPQ